MRQRSKHRFVRIHSRLRVLIRHNYIKPYG
jgi:hypothetical protein